MLGPFCLLLLLFTVCSISAESTFTNPVVNSDHPDPGVLRLADGSFVAVTTSNDASNSFPILTSPDLVNWQERGYVFPEGKQPEWTVSDYWAPEIHEVDGKYYVIYTAREGSTKLLSLGIAYSDQPLGPFIDKGEPMLQNLTVPVGVIDVTYFREEGKDYLIWKTDDNAQNKPTHIFIREFDFITLSFVESSEIVELLRSDRDWESNINEGPWMIKHGDLYFLFFSASGFTDPKYSVEVARSHSLFGPFEKKSTPILHTDWDLEMYGVDSSFVGPGHCSAVWLEEKGSWWMVFHAWKFGKVGQEPGRVMLIDEVEISQEGWPQMKRQAFPTVSAQPLPLGP